MYNVRNYGATGNGTTNDTSAIQAAINAAGAAGGGLVYIPAGTYKIQPANVSASFALQVQFDNITLLGDGPNLTKLDFFLYNGSAADSVPPPVVGGLVQRGYGIQITNTTASATRSNVTLMGFELDGNAGYTGNRAFPANVTTGDGWDLTHKGVYIEHDENFDNILIEDCYIHAWRGEVVYYGGLNLNKFVVRNCKIGDSNADAISAVGQDQLVDGNELYSCVNAACENAYWTGISVYRNNYIHNCDYGGLQVFPASSTVLTGMVDVHDNRIVSCGNSGTGAMYPQGAVNMRIFNNLFVDCLRGIYSISPGLGGDGAQSILSDNVAIFNNRFVVQNTDVEWCIGVFSDFFATRYKRLHIYDNQGIVSATGIAAGKAMNRMIEAGGSGWLYGWGEGCRFRRNEIQPGSQDNTQSAKVVAWPLTTTSLQTIATLTFRYVYMARISCSWMVYGGGSNLTLTINWTDFNDVAQSHTLASGAQADGHYYASFEVSAHGLPSSFHSVDITAQAGTANRVRVNAEIWDDSGPGV